MPLSHFVHFQVPCLYRSSGSHSAAGITLDAAVDAVMAIGASGMAT
ncbi:MAG: hypothetical protein JWM97_1429, partial [Phycisphaerales bacterium]|nr:hypothetical protein [Phycisphaerales bacterium]